MNMRNNAITIKRALLILTLIVFMFACVAGCSQAADEPAVNTDQSEGLAERNFRKQLADAGVTEIEVKNDLVLEAPVELSGTKVLYGEGSITAVGDSWTEDGYMIVIPSGGQLTVKGSLTIDAAGIAGGVRTEQNALWILEESASVKNASARTANGLVEGELRMNGGTLADANGHNIDNRGKVTVSGGEIIGSGAEHAGIYGQGVLVQDGGILRGAYNNVVVLSGGSFTFNGGENLDSIRDGIYIAEGATLSVTSKKAVITGSGVRGIHLYGEAAIDGIALSLSGDSLVKIGSTGVLTLSGGTLTEAGYHGIDNAGTLTMTGGSIRNCYNCGIVNTGTLELTGGSIMDNLNNKGVLNKHDGKATISGGTVMFSGNRFAIANEDTAHMDLSGAEVLLTTVTNIYAFDGTVHIHDITLGAAGSNNVRIYKADVTMSNVQVMGNTASGSASTHGILLEGGSLNAKDVTIKNVTGYGVRNKGGRVTFENLVINTSSKAGGISNMLQDHTGVPGIMDVRNLTIENIRYNNLVVDGGVLTIKDGHLAASGTNNVKTTGGTLNLENVEILGNLPDTAGTNHAVYMTGGTITAKNVSIQDARFSALRVNGDTAVFNGTKVTIRNSGEYGINQSNGQILIDGLTTENNHFNIANYGGTIGLTNSTLGGTISNNIRIYGGTVDLQNVVVNGHAQGHITNVHALFVSGGNLTGKNVTVQNVANAGLRVSEGTADIQGFTVADAGADGVWVSAGKATIGNLVIRKAGGAGVSVTGAGHVTVKGGAIGNTGSHGVKCEGESALNLKDLSMAISATNGRHAVLAQGGDIHLENVEITGMPANLSGAAIRINRETSHVTGNGVRISNVNIGISASNGTCDIARMTTQDLYGHSVQATDAAKLVVSDSLFGPSGTNNAKAESGGTLTLNNVVIDGTAKNNGIMVEKDGYIQGKNITVRNTAGSAVRVKCSKQGSHVVIDGLTTENIGAQNIFINRDDAESAVGSITVKNGNLCRTVSHNVLVQAGDLTLVNTKIQGHLSGAADNVHTIYINQNTGKVTLNRVTVLDTAGDALRVSAGNVVATGFTAMKAGRHGVWADGGSLNMSGGFIDNTVKHGIYNTRAGVVLTSVTLGDCGSGKLVFNEGTGVTTVNGLTVRSTKSGMAAVYHAGEDARTQVSGTITLPVGATGVHVESGSVTVKNARISGGMYAIRNAGTVTVTGGSMYDNVWAVYNEPTGTATLSGGYYYGNASGVTNSDLYNAGKLIIENITLGYTPSGDGASGVLYQAAEAEPIVLKGSKVGLHKPSKPMVVVAEDWQKKWGEHQTVVICDSSEVAADVRESFVPGKNDPVLYISRRDNTLELTTKAGGNFILAIGDKPFESFADAFLYMKSGDMTEATLQVLDSFEMFEAVEIPEGYRITLTDDGTGHYVLKPGNITGHMFTVGKDAELILSSTNDSVSSLSFDGAKKAGIAVVYANGGKATLSSRIAITGSAYGLYVADGEIVTAENAELILTGCVDSGIYVTGGSLNVSNVKISGGKVGISVSGGKAVVNGTELSENASGNIRVSGGELILNAYADGTRSQIGTSGPDNIVATSGGIVRLTGVDVAKSNANNIVATGGKIYLTDTDVTGGTYSVLVQTAGYAELNNVTINDPARDAIRVNAADGTVVVSDVRANNSVRYGISADKGTVTVKGQLTISGANGSRGIYAYNGGKVTAGDGCSVNITGAEYGILAESNANVTLNNVTISGSGVNGIKMTGGTMALNGADISGSASSNIHVSGGELTLNGYANGDKSQVGTCTQDNICATGTGVIRLNDVEVQASNKNNVVAITGGTVHMTNSTVNGGNHSVLADNTGTVYLKSVTLKNSASSGIRANHSASYVEATDVTIDGAKTGLNIKSGTVKISGITIRNTKDVGVNVAQADSSANVTLSSLVTENCGTYAIYTSGASAILTVNGATLANDGSDHVVNVNGGPVKLNDVTIGTTPSAGKYEVYSNAGWLTIGGAMDADMYVASGRIVKVNKELTGDKLSIAWAKNPTGNVLEFTNVAMMDASVDNIRLGKTHTDAGMLLYYFYTDAAGKGYARLVSNVVTNETELTEYLTAAGTNKIADVTILIGDSFTVEKQVAIPAGITGLTIREDGDAQTGSTVTYSGSTDGLFLVNSGLKLTLKDITLASTEKILLRQSGGELVIENCTLSGYNKNLYQTAGKATIRDSVLSQTTSNNLQTAGELILEGEVSLTGPSSSGGTHGVYAQGGKVTVSGTVSITGTSGDSMQISGGAEATVTGTLSINGGGRNGVMLTGGGKLTVSGTLNIADAPGNGVSINHWGNETVASTITVTSGGKLSVSGSGAAGIQIQNLGALNTQAGSELTISGSGTNAIKMTGGTAVMNGADISGSASNNIYVSGGELTLNGYANGDKSQVGTCTQDNICATGTGVIRLNDVEVQASKKNNVVAITGGTVHMTDSTVTGGNHSVLADNTGTVYLKSVTLKNSATSGIRANHSASYVEATDVTIDGAKTGLNIKSGTVKISGITIRNTKDVGVNVAQSGSPADVTLSSLVTENCGTCAIYTSGTYANLTVNGATLANDGSDHVVNVNGGPVTLHDVTIGTTPSAGKYEVYSGAGWLTIGGAMDADLYINTNPGRIIKVNKELTGDKLTLEWAKEVSGNALEFTNVAMMDASVDNIRLGKTHTDAGMLLYYFYTDAAGKGYAKLVSNIVTSETELNEYLTAAGTNKIAETTVWLGDSFTVSDQITIPAGITGLTVRGEGKTLTYGGSEKELLVWNGCKTLSLVSVTVDGGKLGNVNVPTGTRLNLTNVTVSQPQSRGIQFSGQVHLSGTVTVDNTDGNGSVWGISGDAGGVLTSDAGTVVNISNCQYGFVANGGAKLTTGTLNVTGTAKDAIYVDGTGSSMQVTKAVVSGTTDKAVHAKNGTLTIQDLTVSGNGGNGIHVNGCTVTVEKANLGAINKAVNNILVSKGTLTLKNATVGKVGKNNNVCINGGTVNLHNVEVLGNDMTGGDGKHLLYANGTSQINATGYLRLSDGSAAGIRMDGSARMIAETVEISGTDLYGIRNTGASYLEVKRLTIGASAANDAPSIGIQSQKADTVIKITESAVLSAKNYNVVGDNGTIEITGATINKTTSNNVATSAGSIKLTDSTVLGHSATGNVHAVFARGGDIVLQNVTISGAATAGIRINNANSTVTGTDVTISGCAYGVTMNAGELSLTDVTVTAAANRGVIVDGGKVTVGGKVVAEVDCNSAVALNIGSTLAEGSALTVDWADGKVPADSVVLNFAAGTLEDSKPYITLGATQAAINYLVYEGSTGKLVPFTAITSWADLSAAVSAQASGTDEIYKVSGEASGWTVSTPLTIPEGVGVTLFGDAASPAIVANAGVSPFVLNANTELILDSLTVGGTASAKAGHIIVPAASVLTVKGTTMQHFSGVEGGAVHVNNGTLNVIGSTFANNTNTSNWGGAIGVWGGTVNISESRFTGNSAKSGGGAVFVYKADTNSLGGSKDQAMSNLTLTDSVFTGNTSSSAGGAVSLWTGSTSTITGCVFGDANDSAKANSASTNGGAIHIQDSHTVTIDDCEFYGNSAKNGGAVYSTTTKDLTVKNSVFTGNVASTDAGALGSTSVCTITGCTFNNNRATANGGAVGAYKFCTVTDCTFTGNSGGQGGAITVSTGHSLRLQDVVCSGNVTTGAHGAYTTCGFGDIRVADNTKGGSVTISGKIVGTFWNNQPHAIHVIGALTEGSQAVIDWRLGKLGAGDTGLIFSSEEIMKASMAYIQLGTDASVTEGWEFRYATEEPWQATLVKKP